MNQFSDALFQEIPVVGILRGYTIEKTINIVEAYYQGGFRTIEVTMNTPKVEIIIEALVKKYSNRLNIGVGTVCNDEDLEIALKAGAQFIVSPIVDIDLIKKCKELEVPVFPGAYTPTEIYQAWTAGARMVKLFPASDLGPTYVENVLAPLNQVELMPTGGVALENMPTYKKAGAKAFGVGSLLFDKALIETEDWIGLTIKLKTIFSLIKSMKI